MTDDDEILNLDEATAMRGRLEVRIRITNNGYVEPTKVISFPHLRHLCNKREEIRPHYLTHIPIERWAGELTSSGSCMK